MVSIKNDRLEIFVSERGAELKRVLLDGKDVLWDGNPQYWDGTAPLLFPICGGLRDDKFTIKGKEYTLEKHGFAMNSDFIVEKIGDNFITFLLTDTKETLKKYPWRFELRVTYKLIGKAIRIEYATKNLSKDTMYFSIGSHEAYACPEGTEDYDIIFPQKETLETWYVDGNLIDHKTSMVLKDSAVLPIHDKYFEIDALIFKDLKSRSAKLRNRTNGREITVEFPYCDYLLIWKKMGAPYLCIEPWSGIPSMVDAGYEIDKKEGIIALESGKTDNRHHTIYF